MSTINIFENFSSRSIKMTKYKSIKVSSRIKDLDQQVKGIWNPEQIRKACSQNFDTWFNTNVKDKKRQEFDKNFHLSAKRSVRYRNKGRILDLHDGPIISEEDFI